MVQEIADVGRDFQLHCVAKLVLCGHRDPARWYNTNFKSQFQNHVWSSKDFSWLHEFVPPGVTYAKEWFSEGVTIYTRTEPPPRQLLVYAYVKIKISMLGLKSVSWRSTIRDPGWVPLSPLVMRVTPRMIFCIQCVFLEAQQLSVLVFWTQQDRQLAARLVGAVRGHRELTIFGPRKGSRHECPEGGTRNRIGCPLWPQEDRP